MKVFLFSVSSLLLAVPGTSQGPVLPKEADPDTPWEDLVAVLSDPGILTTGNAQEWQEQCVKVFNDITFFPGVDGSFPIVSNYLTMNQPSGLCLDHVSCAFENCNWPPTSFPDYPLDASPFVIFEGSNSLTDADLESDKLLLPAMVLQPQTVGDVVKAVEFCKVHQIGVTVKVAGHSYFGASTGKNTLLIKMNPSYPKYGIDGSLTECESVASPSEGTTPTANEMACAVASSRGKNAVLRVGGGEIFDEAYRAVSIEWNRVEGNNKYHLVGGGAGTVSAAGGWMASGGLSGTTGMRLFGIGIDNVVALEMVLPSGQHVRMAPTEWEEVEGGYPKTLAVTGYCNSNTESADESTWEWVDCDPAVDFSELWFAARGGGGGTYGIVTSLHYQLHDYPGVLQLVSQDPTVYPESAATTVSDEAAFFFGAKHIEFLLRFLYSPETLGVSEEASRGCNSALTANLSPFVGGLFFCYGDSGTVFIETWKAVITDPTIVSELQENGVPDDVIAALPGLYIISTESDSYADQGLEGGAENEQIPEGRLQDSPPGSVVPVLGGYPSLADSTHTHIPLFAVQADPVGMSQLLALTMGPIYAMGGMVPFADDGLNSLSSNRRNAAFLLPVTNQDIRDALFGISYAGLDMATMDFPGSSCHNHALIFEMGPLKDDWTKSCPRDLPQEEREEKCLSQNEASWGTANLARLEAFKAEIDPDNLFICASGVGYSNPSGTEEDETSEAPSVSPKEEATSISDAPTAAPDDEESSGSPTNAPDESWASAVVLLYSVLSSLLIATVITIG